MRPANTGMYTCKAHQLLPVAAQAKDLPTLQRLGETQRSGILDCYSCCQLSQNPGFPGMDVKSAQVLTEGNSVQFALIGIANSANWIISRRRNVLTAAHLLKQRADSIQRAQACQSICLVGT